MKNNKKKIFFIMSTDDYSGAEAVNFSIIDNLKEEFDFYWVSKKGRINNFLDENSIKWIEISELSTKEIKRIVSENKPDILHATDYKTSCVCALANVKVKLISHLHNNAPWIKTLHPYSFLYLYCSKKFDTILTVSDSIKKEYIFSNLIKEKIVSISNPVSRKKILSVSNIIQEKVYDVCFVGRMTKAKNPIKFVDIINELKTKHSDIKVVMVGSGELDVTVNGYIDFLELRNNITLLGFQKNPYDYMSQSKIFCSTSTWEGYGLVAFEAMTLGLPTVVSKVGGLVEIVDDSCGKLCTDNREFVEEINSLLSDDKKLAKKTSGAIKKSKKIDNIKEYMHKLTEIYNK